MNVKRRAITGAIWVPLHITHLDIARLRKAARLHEAARPRPSAQPAPAVRASLAVLVGVAVVSVAFLFCLEIQQYELQEIESADNAQSLRANTLRSVVRKCLTNEPFLLLPRNVGEASDPSGTGRDTVAVAATNEMPPGMPAIALSQPRPQRLPLAGPLSLEAMAQRFVSDPPRAFSEWQDAPQMARCAFATEELKRLKVRGSAVWRDVFTEGSSLNTALRLTRIALLGLFALAAAELLLRLLKWLKLPVLSLTELGKLVNDANGAPKEEAKPQVAAPLLSLLSTALVTGVAGVVAVGPELAQQTLTTARVLESKTLDARSVQTVKVEETHKDTTTIREVDDEALAKLRRSLEMASRDIERMSQRLAQLERKSPDEAMLKLKDQLVRNQKAAEDSARQQEQRLSRQMEVLSSAQRQQYETQLSSLDQTRQALDAQIRIAREAAIAARVGTEDVQRSVHQRGCATLAYFKDVETQRWWPLKDEAARRLQILRDIMQQSDPTADCDEFLSERRPVAVSAATDGHKR